MTHAEAGRKGGRASGLARLKKSRGWLREALTRGDVLRELQQAERRAYEKGWAAGNRRGYRKGWADALGEREQ